jgi:hypothetical protein
MFTLARAVSAQVTKAELLTPFLVQAALREEPTIEKGKFGPRVAAWMGQMMRKAADGSWSVAAGAAGNVLSDLLMKYYGG